MSSTTHARSPCLSTCYLACNTGESFTQSGQPLPQAVPDWTRRTAHHPVQTMPAATRKQPSALSRRRQPCESRVLRVRATPLWSRIRSRHRYGVWYLPAPAVHPRCGDVALKGSCGGTRKVGICAQQRKDLTLNASREAGLLTADICIRDGGVGPSLANGFWKCLRSMI